MGLMERAKQEAKSIAVKIAVKIAGEGLYPKLLENGLLILTVFKVL